MPEIFDDFRALVKKDPAAVKRWVDFTNATRRMNAAAPLASHPVAAGAAANLSDLFLSLQGTANQHIIDFQDRQNANRAQMMQQFANEDTLTNKAHTESQNYLTDLAKRLGIQDALVGKTQGANNDDWLRINQLNRLDRTNQTAALDNLRKGYGEVMGHEAAGYDAQHAQALSDLYAAIPPPAPVATGGSSRSRRSGSGGSGGPSQSNLAKFYATVKANELNPGVHAINPANPLKAFAEHYNPIVPGYYTGHETPPGGSNFAGQKGKAAVNLIKAAQKRLGLGATG